MRLLALMLLVAASTTPRVARAADDDGLYGRLDGDLHVSLDAAVAWDRQGPWAATLVRAMYLDTIGPYLAFEQALGTNPDWTRTLSAGISFRPLLLPRWGTDFEHGPTRLDLTLDSLTLDLGALWSGGYAGAPPAGDFPGSSSAAQPGFELGLGIGVPVSPSDDGFWIGCRGALRYTAEELARDGAPHLGPIAMITLGWHHGFAAHLVDASDQRSP